MSARKEIDVIIDKDRKSRIHFKSQDEAVIQNCTFKVKLGPAHPHMCSVILVDLRVTLCRAMPDIMFSNYMQQLQ